MMTNISSRVGVTYPIRVIKRIGTWSTELDMNFMPSRSLSSHVACSKFIIHERIYKPNFRAIIFGNPISHL